jgi:hypothetical protein
MSRNVALRPKRMGRAFEPRERFVSVRPRALLDALGRVPREGRTQIRNGRRVSICGQEKEGVVRAGEPRAERLVRGRTNVVGTGRFLPFETLQTAIRHVRRHLMRGDREESAADERGPDGRNLASTFHRAKTYWPGAARASRKS